MTDVKRKDLDSLADKLGPFLKDLPDQERQVLGWVLTRAQHASDQELSGAGHRGAVAGGAPPPPLSTQLARSVGFTDDDPNGVVTIGGSISGSWSKA